MQFPIIIQADRQLDSGKYTIRLTCEGGNFEASGFVNVLDVPAKPKSLIPGKGKGVKNKVIVICQQKLNSV